MSLPAYLRGPPRRIRSASTTSEPDFISEPITAEPGSGSVELMVQGLAALPSAFVWRNRRYEIRECLEHVKRTGQEGGRAGADRYLRRQEFVVRLDSGQTARIYFERQSRPGSSPAASRQRWFLYTIEDG